MSLQLNTAVAGVGNSDGLSAAAAATAMLLGLVARQRGAGVHKMLTSMISSTAHCLSEVMVEYADKPALRVADTGCYGFSALYRLYLAQDQEWVFLAAWSDAEWARLTRALPNGASLALDSRFATAEARAANDAALAELLGGMFRTRDAGEWERDLRAADIACVMAARGPVEANYMDEGSVGDLSGYVTRDHHPILQEVARLRPLVRFSRSATVAGDAGLVGQHTENVLKEVGYSDAEILSMAKDGTIVLG